MQKSFYRQKLPHIQAENATYFVTYRLYDSVPIPVIQQLQTEYGHALQALSKNNQHTTANEYKLQKKYFAQFDTCLDSNLNEPYWLQQTEIAQVVYDSLLHLGNTAIDLHCFTIMSNHVHALFDINNNNTDLYKILQSHKSFTAKKCNAILQR
jgi:putative transposase